MMNAKISLKHNSMHNSDVNYTLKFLKNHEFLGTKWMFSRIMIGVSLTPLELRLASK